MSLTTILNPGDYTLRVVYAEVRMAKLKDHPYLFITIREEETLHEFHQAVTPMTTEVFRAFLVMFGMKVSDLEVVDLEELGRFLITKKARFRVVVDNYMNRYYNRIDLVHLLNQEKS